MKFLLVPRRAKQEVVLWPWHFGHNVFCGICSLSRSFASPQPPAVRLSRHDQQPPQLAASSVDGCVDDQDYNDGAQNDHPIGKLNAGYRCLFAKPFHDYPAIFKQRLAKGEAPTEGSGPSIVALNSSYRRWPYCPQPGETMRRQELSPAARRRGDRIRVSRIAALLSALIVLTAVHRTQAQHAPDASWTNPHASAPHSSELVTPKEDLGLRYVDRRNIGVRKISS